MDPTTRTVILGLQSLFKIFPNFFRGIFIWFYRLMLFHLGGFFFPWLRRSYFLLDDWDAVCSFYRTVAAGGTPKSIDFLRDPVSGKNIPQIVIFDNIRNPTPLDRLILEKTSRAFPKNETIDAATEESFERWKVSKRFLDFPGSLASDYSPYYTENSLRLVEIKKEYGNIIFVVQPVGFEQYIRTNLCIDFKKNKHEQSLREKWHQEGRLDSLGETPFANICGISSLLFTLDGQLIVPERSTVVGVFPGKHSPSSSGSVALDDVPEPQITMRHFRWFREGIEELGLEDNDILPSTGRFLGVTRELVRGGQPEMFWSGKLKISKAQLEDRFRGARDRWETKKIRFFNFQDLAFDPLENDLQKEAFQEKIRLLFAEFGGKASLPFATNIALWVQMRLANSD